MHIEDYKKTFLPTPTDDPIQKLVALALQLHRLIFGNEQSIVERNANGVEPGLLYEPDIFCADVIFAISPPERSRLIFTNQLIDEFINQSWRVGSLELEHVTLGHQPVAEVDTFEKKRFSIRRY